jgi:hypothetical protein
MLRGSALDLFKRDQGAVGQVLSSRDAYMQFSERARAAAVRVPQQGSEQLAGVVRWLQEQVQQNRTDCGVTER